MLDVAEPEATQQSLSLQLIVNEKSQNLRRLQAQRNELNAKGTAWSNSALLGWAWGLWGGSGPGLGGSGGALGLGVW